MPIRCPLLAVRPEAHALLLTRAVALLREAAEPLTCHPVEVEADVAAGWLHVHAFVAVDHANLDAVRTVDPGAEVGDEVGLDLWNPTMEAAVLLELDLARWQSFWLGVCRELRAWLDAEHRLSEAVRSAWINLDYARATNERHPELNPLAPGRPYFAGTASPGQWIRIVLELDHSHVPLRVWGVGTAVPGTADEVSFHALRYEGGAERPPELFAAQPFEGTARLAFDGIWDVVQLQPSERRARAVTGVS